MWTQNLMESPNHFKTMFGWMRGRLGEFKWEYCWRKDVLDPIFKFVVDIGGTHRDDGDVLFVFGLLGFSVYLTVPNLVPIKYRHIWSYFDNNGKSQPGNGMGRSYGVRWDQHSFSADWHKSIGESSSVKPNPYGWGVYWWNPWNWEHMITEYVDKDLRWVKENNWNDKQQYGKTWTAPYVYKLRNGEIQKVTATVRVDRMQWGIRGLVKLGLGKYGPIKKHQSISVSFDGEVGERAGSWKGGTIGCGYEMKKGETPLATLRRMERERKFE